MLPSQEKDEPSIDTQIIIEMFKLFSSLGAGRNMAWRPFLQKIFPSEFLKAALWMKKYKPVRRILFNLLYNVYLDQYPLEQAKHPDIVLIMNDPAPNGGTFSEAKVRKNMKQNAALPQEIIISLCDELVKNLTNSVKTFSKEIEDIISEKSEECSMKKEVKVPDLPVLVVDSIEFIQKILKLNVFEVLGQTHAYTTILKHCMMVFDFNQLLPSYFVFLQEIPGLKLKKAKKNNKPIKFKFTGLNEQEGKTSILRGNYYALKNEIFNVLSRAVSLESQNHVTARFIVIDILNRFLDLRQQFLLENYTSWVRTVGEDFKEKPYLESEEDRLSQEYAATLQTVIPSPIPTGIPNIDEKKRTGKKAEETRKFFVRYVSESRPEVYDLPHLLLNEPGTRPQRELQYQNIIPSLLVAVMSSEEEQMSNSLINLLFRNFSQRRELYSNIRKAFLISEEIDDDRYRDMCIKEEGLTKVLERLELWNRNEAMVMEATDMSKVFESIKDTLQGVISTKNVKDIRNIQDMFYHSGCCDKVIAIYSSVVFIFGEYQENSKFADMKTKELMLTILKLCLELLKLFVIDNTTYKNYLIKHLEIFLSFTRYNIGQSDLLSEMFVHNIKADYNAQKKMLQYFSQRIINEGNQTRFLEFYFSYIESRANDTSSNSLNIVLDTFLPYTISKELEQNLKLVYGYFNESTGEQEMYLNDDFSSFKEDFSNALIVFKSEPFIYHRRLLELFIRLMRSDIANISRIRLRKYYSLGYIIRLFLETDAFNQNLDPAENIKEDYLARISSPQERHKVGLTLIKPLLAQIAYKVYIKGEKNIFRSISHTINSITKLIDAEKERLKVLQAPFDPKYASYISQLTVIFLRMFESKLNNKADSEDDLADLILFLHAIIDKHELLHQRLEEEHLKLLGQYVKEFCYEDTRSKYEMIEQTLLRPLTSRPDDISNKVLEKKAENIKPTYFNYEIFWELAEFELKTQQATSIREEIDTLAKLVHSFDILFEKELRQKYGVTFKVTDFLTKIMNYVSNSLVNTENKMISFDFLIRLIEVSDNFVITQDLLDKIGITKSVLLLLSETQLADDRFVCKILDFFTSLLKGGNKEIQKSIYECFEGNSKATGNLFFYINNYFELFYKILPNTEFINGIKFDSKLETVEKIIQFFQQMCENHFEDLQNYLRSQPNLRKKYNFLDMVCRLLKMCTSNPINKTYNLFRLSLDFLIEMLQGPCFPNQRSLVELNLVSNLNSMLKWPLNQEGYKDQINKGLTITSKSKLVKSRVTEQLAKEFEVEEGVDFDHSLTRNLKAKYRMSNSKIVAVKYKALVAIMALLEMQRDKGLISKLKKEIQYRAIKKLVIEVYVEFLERYNGLYVIETLNHFDPKYLNTLTPDKRNQAKQFIIETGFLAFFIMLKLSSSKTERDEEIKEDLKKLQKRKGEYRRIGLVNQSIISNFKREESDILLKTVKPEHSKSKSEHSEFMSTNTKSIFEEAAHFFNHYSSKIEIVRENLIQEIYFIKMPYTVYLDDSDKEKFNLDVDRSTTLNKVKGLFEEVNYFTVIMRFAYILKTRNIIVTLLMNYESFYTLISFLTVKSMLMQACSVNILIAISYITEDETNQAYNLNHAFLAERVDTPTTILIIRCVGAIHIFIGLRFMVFYILKRIYMARFGTDFKEAMNEKRRTRLKKIWFAIDYFVERNISYYTLYTVFAFLGVFLHPFFFAFHLYEIMNQFKTCRIFIMSIIAPYKQLIYAFVYYNILIYEYAVLGYFFFWRYFVDSKAEDDLHQGHYCDSMYMCFLTLYDQTNKEPGGIGSFLDFFDETPAIRTNYRAIYDISFKFFVPIIMLSIVKGIIVDTFGALREEDQEKTEDMEGKCYICGLERESFDKIRTKTFIEHIKTSHYMWDYVYFLVYLNQKSVTEHNGEELYVYENTQRGKYDWVPDKRCLEIDENEENDFDEMIKDKLEENRKKIVEIKQGYTLACGGLSKFIKGLQ